MYFAVVQIDKYIYLVGIWNASLQINWYTFEEEIDEDHEQDTVTPLELE